MHHCSDYNSHRGPLRIYFERTLTGWLVWDKAIGVYQGADLKEPAFQRWDKGSQAAISAVREVVRNKKFWEKLAVHYTSENQSSQLAQDNISTVKSLCKLRSNNRRPR
jgi:proteasome activator subunit 4